jgi:hypothetical protein
MTNICPICGKKKQPDQETCPMCCHAGMAGLCDLCNDYDSCTLSDKEYGIKTIQSQYEEWKITGIWNGVHYQKGEC